MNILLSARACLLATVALTVPLAAGTEGVPLVIDPSQSRVEIAVKSTLRSFVARLEDFDAAIAMDPETGRVGKATFHADFAAVKTGNTDRDSDMNRWQQTGQFPKVVFELEALDPGQGDEFTARGRFQFHGQQREISLPVKISNDHGLVAIDGTVALNTRDYGLPVIKKAWVLRVDPVVHVRFHLQGKLTAERPAPPTEAPGAHMYK